MKIKTGSKIESKAFSRLPEFLESTTNFAVKDRLFGGRSTTTDFILLKEIRDIEVSIVASGISPGYTRHTGQHGIDRQFEPFIQVLHYTTDAFVLVPERFTSQVISNAYIENRDFYIDVYNFDINPINITLRLLIYELRKKI